MFTGSASADVSANILVVDDDAVARDTVVRLLRSVGYQTVDVCNGADALQAIAQQRPCLVLLDITIPAMSGLEVLHTVRQRYGGLDMPILMTALRSESEDATAALHLGANDCLIKPLKPQALLRRVSTLIGHQRLAQQNQLLQRRLELLTAAQSLCVSTHDPTGRFVEASASLCELLDRSASELVSMRLYDLFHPEDAAGVAHLSDGLPDTYTLLARIDRGAQFTWCEVEHQALRDGVSGELVAVQAVWSPQHSGDVAHSARRSASRPLDPCSFAFQAPSAPQALGPRTRVFGPPVAVDATPIPWPRAEHRPVVVAPAGQRGHLDDPAVVPATERRN